MYDIRDYGAVGDGQANNAPAIQQAIEQCAAHGGGTVLVPAGGSYLTGQVDLRSHVNLHLEGGARLAASLDAAHYPDRTLIRAVRADNVALTGLGTIDGRGVEFMQDDERYIYRFDGRRGFRPRLIHLLQCDNVTLRDLTIRDSPSWAVHPTGCRDVLIHGLRILNDLKVPNCDGIDPDNCHNVRISDCHIEAGDDCIVLKSTERYRDLGPCENITVSGCTLVSTSAALKIGTEIWAGVRDVVFDACVIRRSNRGLAILLRDEGDVENVVFSNMVVETRLFYDAWWGKAEPIHVSAGHRHPERALGKIRHVRFSNVLCRGESGAYLGGSPDSVLEDVVLDNVRIEVDKTSKWPGGMHDRRPPGDAGHLYPHRTAGVFAEHARDLALRNVTVAWGDNRPETCGPALECYNVSGLDVQQFKGESAHPDVCPARIVE